eukprot:2574833-Pyramimonas_sp.AAC.1
MRHVGHAFLALFFAERYARMLFPSQEHQAYIEKKSATESKQALPTDVYIQSVLNGNEARFTFHVLA